MNWSLPDYTAPPNAEESYNQLCGRNGLDAGWYGNRVLVERNGVVERGVICGDRNGRDVDRKESTVPRSRRDVARNESNVDRSIHVTSDVAHSIFQLATLSRKKFAQHSQPGRKLDFTHELLVTPICPTPATPTALMFPSHRSDLMPTHLNIPTHLCNPHQTQR